MRTTSTLDDDVAAKIGAEVRRTGKPLRTVANRALRAGLLQRKGHSDPPRFKVRSKPLGLRPGLSYDNVEELSDIAQTLYTTSATWDALRTCGFDIRSPANLRSVSGESRL